LAAELPSDLVSILIELSNALGKHAMYPRGHPMLDTAADQLTAQLSRFLAERSALALGVSPTQIIVGGVGSDPTHPVLRELAARLHRQNIGALKFYRGLKREELEGALRVLAGEDRGGPARRWQHIRMLPLSYSQLELIGAPGDPAGTTWASRLWFDLSEIALESDVPTDAAADPAQVARAIDARQRDDHFGKKIAESLVELLDACRARGGSEAIALQSRISKLISSMAPESLERLVSLEVNDSARRRFLLDVAQSMAVDAVLDLLQAAAAARSRSISPALLQLLGKLAEYSEAGGAETRTRAEFAFRTQVRQLIEGWDDWEARDPAPFDHQRTMEHLELAGKSPLRGHSSTYECEPERVLMMSLEVGVANSSTHAAAAFLIHQGRTAQLREWFSTTTAPALAAEILRGAATEAVLRAMLSQEPLDTSGLELIIPLLKEAALPPLIGALAGAETTERRDQLLRLLAPFGEASGTEAQARLPAVSWAEQRNLLILIARLPSPPRGFSPTLFIDHPEARVRTEALRILFRGPGTRARAICEALSSSDPALVRMGVFAATEECPPAAVPLLIPVIERGDFEPGIRSTAVTAIASVPQPLVVDCLLGICYVTGRWFRGPRIAPQSPVVLAALAGLARHWAHHVRAKEVLDLAAAHPDEEIRGAAGRKSR
jgi:hypothetical protein